MSATRAAIEAVLVGRTAAYLDAAGKATTVAGANRDLDDPLFRTLVLMGHAPASAEVSDADLAGIDPASAAYLELCDRAELRVLETCQRNLADPSMMVEGLIQVQMAELGKNLSTAIQLCADAIRRNWGEAGAGSSLTDVAVSLSFQQRCSSTPA